MIADVDQQLSDLDNKIIDLEDENKKVKEINGKLDTEVKVLEHGHHHYSNSLRFSCVLLLLLV